MIITLKTFRGGKRRKVFNVKPIRIPMKVNALVGCGGMVEGKIKFILSPEDAKNVVNGDIVITNDNSPLYSIAFLKAGGILSSVGGILCHLAIVSREMKKPCLMGIPNIFELVHDGQKIRLNASQCEIEVLNGE